MAIPLTLKIFRGNDLVVTKEFHRDIIKIGRLSSAHLCLDDDKVSRIHAVIEVAGDGSLSIIDMGSVEGTFVNGKRVNKGTLASGDEISLGNTRIKLEVGAATALAAVPDETATADSTAVSSTPEAPVAGPVVALAPEVAVAPPASPAEQAVVQQTMVSAPPEMAAGMVAQQMTPTPVAASPMPVAPVAMAPAPVPVAAPVPIAQVPLAQMQVPVAAPVPAYAAALAIPEPPEPAQPPAGAEVPAGAHEWPMLAGTPAKPTPLAADERGHQLALDVRFFWGNQQLAAGVFDKEPKVTVGASKLASFQLEAELLPSDQFPLLRNSGGDWYLGFTNRMEGELNRGGQITRLSELVKTRGASPSEDGFEVKLTADSAAWVDLGNIRADVAFRPKPKAALAPLADRLDYQFLNLLLGVFFIAGVAVVSFQNFAFDTDLLADDLFNNQARFTKLILKPPEKKKNPLLDRLKSLDGPKDPGEMAAKAKMDEGKMGKKEAPDRKTRSAPKAIDPNDKEIIKNKGLLAMLGKSNSAGLSTIFGQGGLGGDLQGAIGGITGGAVGDAHGFGGLGLKGTGVGGGGVGNSIGVGDIGTKGRGGGLGGYGTGVGGLGRKGSADVAISSSEAIVMGSLDKELIRKVIAAHRSQIRYCYESELVRNPKLAGKIAVKFVITANGTVSSASTAQTTMGNSTVESCINARVKSWEFPKPKGGGIVVVTYPFIFKQSGD